MPQDYKTLCETTFEWLNYKHMCLTCRKEFGECQSTPHFLIDLQPILKEPIPEQHRDLVYACPQYEPDILPIQSIQILDLTPTSELLFMTQGIRTKTQLNKVHETIQSIYPNRKIHLIPSEMIKEIKVINNKEEKK